jgi:hypothetical protein
LILLGGHQKTVRAQEIVFVSDEDLRVVLGAADFGAFRLWIGVANAFLVDGPGPRQRIVDDRDFVIQDVPAVFPLAVAATVGSAAIE